MKNKFKNLVLLSSLLLGCSAVVSAQTGGGGEANPQLRTHAQSLKKFKDMRFGMFIHWGPVALRGEVPPQCTLQDKVILNPSVRPRKNQGNTKFPNPYIILP